MRPIVVLVAILTVLFGAVVVIMSIANPFGGSPPRPHEVEGAFRRPKTLQLPALRARWTGTVIELYLYNDSRRNEVWLQEGISRVWLSDAHTRLDVPLARLVANMPTVLRPGEKTKTARLDVPANFGRNAKLCFGYFEAMVTSQTEKEVLPESAGPQLH